MPLVLDIPKVQQVYDNYTVNSHAGLTMVIGHPFEDETFKKHIAKEQKAIMAVFKDHGMQDLLVLYEVDFQVHATLIELASQHAKERNDQFLLEEHELQVSSATKKMMNINYVATWIEKTSPFDIELGPEVLSAEHADQTLRITDSGQIVMKGRAKDRHLLAEIREEFELKAGIVHKYGKNDDEFFFVIGYLKPDERLKNPEFCAHLEQCIEKRRKNINLALKVDSVKIIMYTGYSLDRESCLFEQNEFKLGEEIQLKTNLLDSALEAIRHQKELLEREAQQAAI